MKLHTKCRSAVEYRGHKYRLNLTWWRVLQAMELLEREDVFPEDRVSGALALMIKGPHPNSPALLKSIVETFPQGEKGAQKALDFEQDAELIYAAFRQAYAIDLHHADWMQWNEFVSLLGGIPDDTKLAQVVNIRMRPLPSPTKYNRKEIAELVRLKAKWALKGKNQDPQKGITDLFKIMMQMAKEG